MNIANIHSKFFKALLIKLSNSRFFTVSLIIHGLLVMSLGSAVLFRAVVDEAEFFGLPGDGGEGGRFVQETPRPLTPPPPKTQVAQTPVATPQVAAPAATSIVALTSAAPSATNFALPSFIPAPTTPTNLAPAPPAPGTTTLGQLTPDVGRQIQQFTKSWASDGGGGSGRPLKVRRFEFTAYIAKYSGGDWNSTVVVSRDKIVRGSLPNLLYIMGKWSSDRIKANPNPVPLSLSSQEIFTTNPPFIFFTGRRDFVLTEQEVANLRKYLQSGGAIWGDSSLPGKRSRFDIAFRREMKRVLPDINKDWEPLTPSHPIFSANRNYFPEIKDVPAGLNYYKDPVEVLTIYDQIAVIYTSNDYGDMWQIGITADGKHDTRTDPTGRDMIAMNKAMWDLRGVYFRNLEEPALVDAYKFGINVITHLLVRWEDPLKKVPKL